MFALYDQLTVSMASLPASAPSAPGGSPVPDRSPTGVGALPDPAPPLEELSDSDLAKLYQNSTSGRRAEILNILRERNQRATTVSGEFFPDMEYKEEHNAFITIARSRAGDDVATLSESASEMSATTLEPDAFDPVETETTNKVGVQLTGANFKIEPPEIRWYTIPDGYEETVSWVVTPEKEGNLQLMVVLRNKLEVGDTELDLPVRRFPKTVTVSVDIWTQIGRAVSGVETAVDTAQKIGVAIAAVMGFGSVGAAWAAIGAWRRRGAAAPAGITESPATARTTNEPTGREGGTGA
ncbi:MAG: hypothetical protein JJ902_23415 [Roseibium sp.]|nr:hypothetical protein [Roseibium sp.]